MAADGDYPTRASEVCPECDRIVTYGDDHEDRCPLFAVDHHGLRERRESHYREQQAEAYREATRSPPGW